MKDACHLFFETLATKLKSDIVILLRHKKLGVNEIAAQLKEERSKVSHALKSLLECGFVSAEKKGKLRLYSLNSDTMVPLLGLVDKHVKKYCKVCRKKR